MNTDNYVNRNLLDFTSYQITKPQEHIKLGSNESPFNLMDDEFFRKGFEDILKNLDVNRYPDPAALALRQALAKYVSAEPENIVVGNGADEMIHLVLTTFINPGDVVITHSPSFEMYGLNAKILHAQLVEVKDVDFQVDTQGIIKAANDHDAKLIFLCLPNNPTGYVMPIEEVQRIIDETQALIVLDMAYIEFSDEKYEDLVLNPRVIRLRTLSKAFGLAGLRTGYAIADEGIVSAINMVRSPYNLNELSQQLAVFVLKNRDRIWPYVEKITAEKQRFCQILEEMGCTFLSSATNFILLYQPEQREALLESLAQRSIKVRAYPPGSPLANYLRISIGLPEENDELIQCLRGD